MGKGEIEYSGKRSNLGEYRPNSLFPVNILVFSIVYVFFHLKVLIKIRYIG